jgi:hypothetical protein
MISPSTDGLMYTRETCQTSQISVLGLRDIFYEKPQSMLENAGSSVRISVFLGC